MSRRPREEDVRGPRDPVLVGRDGLMERILARLRARPGLLTLAGPRWSGRGRLALEVAARQAAGGARVVHVPPGAAPALRRAGAALVAAGLEPEPARAGRLRPVVLLVGALAEAGDARALASACAGTGTLAVARAAQEPAQGMVARVGPLGAEDALSLVDAAAPGLPGAVRDRVAALGAGLPGVLVPLAREARGWDGGDAPLPLPAALLAEALAPVDALPPAAREIARWAALLHGPVAAARLGRVSGYAATWVDDRLDELVAAGLMREEPGPGPVRRAFCLPLTAAAVVAAMPPSDRRRRHAAMLAAGLALGDDSRDLVPHAVGARDAGAVVALGVRAASRARQDGDPAAARAHAERALAWWRPGMDEAARLRAAGERGVALSELGAWAEAAELLERTAGGLRAAGHAAEALACAVEAATALWYMGRHDAALVLLTREIDAPAADRAEARAEALALAGGMAAMMSRFGRAARLTLEARAGARDAGAHEVAARALVWWGLARCGVGDAVAGRGAFADVRAEAAGAGGARNGTLAALLESHALLAMGYPDEALRVARDGASQAAALGLEEHRLVLLGNLGEALAARGALHDAGERLAQAGEGWAALGREPPTPADPPRAWLLVAEGRLEAALERYHELGGAATLDRTLFEQMAPLAAGHALAAATLGHRGEAEQVAGAALGTWRATDDRMLGVPLLAVVVHAGSDRAARAAGDALSGLAAAGSALAAAFLPLAGAWLGDAGAAGAREASDRLDRLGMGWWAAWARLQAGQHAGARAGAEHDLLAARAAFDAMGAGGWRQRAEAGLRGLGRRMPSRGAGPAPSAELSAREVEVLEAIALGLTNREVGERLFIAERTVARHVARMFTKLGVSTRTAAVRVGREHGILADPAAGGGSAAGDAAAPPGRVPT